MPSRVMTVLHESGTGRVIDEDGYLIAYKDGSLIDIIKKSQSEIDRRYSILERRLSPITLNVGDRRVVVSRGTTLIDTETGNHLTPVRFGISQSDDVECGFERRITFRVDGGPRDPHAAAATISYYESDLQDAIDSGRLITKQRQHHEIMEQLEQLHGGGGDDA